MELEHKIIGFKNGNKIISTKSPKKLRGLNFDYLEIYEVAKPQ